MAIAYNHTKNNSRLTQFEELKDVVIANTVKNVPLMKKVKEATQNKTLSQFQ